MTESMLQPISNTLGISSSIFCILISVGVLLALVISTYLWTGSMFFSSISLAIGVIVTSALGLTPVWIVPIFVVILFLSFMKYSYVGEPQVRYPDSYRSRLIEAYQAKFGYIDPVFIEEIDSHIKAVETLRKGYTRAVHKTQLKKLEKFVELK